MLQIQIFKDEKVLSRVQLALTRDDAIQFAKDAIRTRDACGARIIAADAEGEIVWEAGYIPAVEQLSPTRS